MSDTRFGITMVKRYALYCDLLKATITLLNAHQQAFGFSECDPIEFYILMYDNLVILGQALERLDGVKTKYSVVKREGF